MHYIHLINIIPFFGIQIYKVKTRTVNTRLNETTDQEPAPSKKKLAKGTPNRKEPIPFNLKNYIDSECETEDDNNLLYASFSNTT